MSRRAVTVLVDKPVAERTVTDALRPPGNFPRNVFLTNCSEMARADEQARRNQLRLLNGIHARSNPCPRDLTRRPGQIHRRLESLRPVCH